MVYVLLFPPIPPISYSLIVPPLTFQDVLEKDGNKAFRSCFADFLE